jgi:hypothetical protein
VNNGIRAKFCCTDTDCGAGKCDMPNNSPSGVGIYVGGNGGSASASSSSTGP